MDFSFVVVVIYAIILGLVAPYISVHSEKYGALLPPAIGLASGSILWSVLIWVGMPNTNAWLWMIIMVLMPVAMIVGANRVAKMRDEQQAEELLLNKSNRA
jgi:hypothetical protein